VTRTGDLDWKVDLTADLTPTAPPVPACPAAGMESSQAAETATVTVKLWPTGNFALDIVSSGTLDVPSGTGCNFGDTFAQLTTMSYQGAPEVPLAVCGNLSGFVSNDASCSGSLPMVMAADGNLVVTLQAAADAEYTLNYSTPTSCSRPNHSHVTYQLHIQPL
jgi:hypothetical protein